MTLLLREEDLDGVPTVELAMTALKEAMRMEAAGETDVPPRLTTGSPDGWLRLMPAVMGTNGGRSLMGFKAMNLKAGKGVRYIVMLYDGASGDLLAILDAAGLTKLRTAAVTAIACELTGPSELRELGIFGSGFEASGHLWAMKELHPELERVVVHSPNAERREAFARWAAERWELEVEPVANARLAAEAAVLVLATKAREPVTRADWLRPGTLVLSIGSTRLDLRELDEAAFARSPRCVCDAPEQLAEESGDVAAALEAGHLRRDALVPLASLVTGEEAVAWPPEDLSIFKSVGTALQDIAVGAAVYDRCVYEGRGVDLGRFPVRNI